MNEITTQPAVLQSLDEIERVAAKLSASGLMGKDTKPEAVFGLMLLCKCEGLDPIAAMKRYHIIEGRPSMRADAMQAEFIAHGGGVVFHVRSDDMCAATFFADRSKLDDAARKRAVDRFEKLWLLECEPDPAKRSQIMLEVAKLSMDGEEGIIRTYADCELKGITEGAKGTKANWKTSPRQMLTARVLTEGIRLVAPGLIAGVYTPEEVQDVLTVEQKGLYDRASAPQSNDLEAMQLILKQHEENAMAATTESERKRYQGLAADMRILIQEAWDKEKPSGSIAEFTQKVVNRVSDKLGIAKGSLVDLKEKPVKMSAIPVRKSLRNPQSEKEEALLDEADDVPMTHASDLVHRGPAASATLPPVTLEAKVDHVEPPKKETRRVPEKPDAPEPTEKKPAIGSNDPLVTELSKWADYRVHLTTSTAFHKTLKEFSQPEIAILYKKRSLPFLNAPDDALRLEAEMIRQAHDSK